MPKFPPIAAPFDPFAQFLDFIPWVSLDGCTVVVSEPVNGGIVVYGNKLAIWTGEGVGDYSYLAFKKSWEGIYEAGKPVTWELFLPYIDEVPAQQNIWLRLAEVVTDPPVDLDGHIGWKVVNENIYASSGNNLAVKLTDTGVDYADGMYRTRLKIVFTPGSDAKFYINDNLVATHTTELPTQTYCKPFFYVETLVEFEIAELGLNRMLFKKAYTQGGG